MKKNRERKFVKEFTTNVNAHVIVLKYSVILGQPQALAEFRFETIDGLWD